MTITLQQLFSNSETVRYSRHFLLPGVGIEGQKRLKSARVLCVGAGALGSVVLPILVSAGIGKVGIADNDQIELTNLHRQTLYQTAEVGEFKVSAAKKRLQAINPEIEIATYNEKVVTDNAEELLKGYDYVIDCTDNLPSRYLLSAVCVYLQIPYIYGGIYQFAGQCSVLALPNAPCYHCLYPECPPANALPNCAEAGVISSLPAIIGAIQANELFKLVLGIGSGLIGKLFTIDALTMSVEYYQVEKRKNCESCSEKKETLALQALVKHPEVCIIQKGLELSPIEAKAKLTASTITLLDIREPHERTLGNIGGYHVPLSSLLNCIEKIKRFNTPLLIYCASGKRSIQAVHLLKQHHVDCYSLQGGIQAWFSEFGDSQKNDNLL